ncbi:MAG: GDP-L-fucose synthase [Alphaproteobacteria bacterium]|nr:GDP-L-fucose synthase [Alphaproteobacteria bacterium]
MIEFSLENKRIWVCGGNGLVGNALIPLLQEKKCTILAPSRSDLDLTRQSAVEHWAKENKPEIVFLLAAKVGGIYANNTFPAEFIYQNIMISSNVINTAYEVGVKKLLFLGSACSYPKFAPMPIKEESLLEGALEPTNEPYAVAKIASIKLCQTYRRQYGCDFIAGVPTNLYGPGDRFHPLESHVIPALMRRFHEAKLNNLPSVEIWGTGTPQREFLHVQDLAKACIFLMESYSSEKIINIGSGEEITIRNLVNLVKEVIGYPGDIVFDSSKPDGAMRKVLDTARLKGIGWSSSIYLKDGLMQTYAWAQQNIFI